MYVSGATSIAVFGLLCCVCSRGAEGGGTRREGRGRGGEAHGCAILLSGRYLDTTAMRADHSSVFMDGTGRDEEGTERGGEGRGKGRGGGETDRLA